MQEQMQTVFTLNQKWEGVHDILPSSKPQLRSWMHDLPYLGLILHPILDSLSMLYRTFGARVSDSLDQMLPLYVLSFESSVACCIQILCVVLFPGWSLLSILALAEA